MRASINEPGFIRGTKVFVDGVDVTNHVHTADEELGMAWGFDWNEQGRHYLNADKTDVVRRTWVGDVRIVLP